MQRRRDADDRTAGARGRRHRAGGRSTCRGPCPARWSRARSWAAGWSGRGSSCPRPSGSRRPARTTAPAAAARCSTPRTGSWRRGRRTWCAGRWPRGGSRREVGPVLTSPPRSRRRATFAGRRLKGGALVGLHGRASGTLTAVPGCLLMRPEIMATLPALEALTEAGRLAQGRDRAGGDRHRDGRRRGGAGAKPAEPGAVAELAAIAAAARAGAADLERRAAGDAGLADAGLRAGAGGAAAGRVPAGDGGGRGGAHVLRAGGDAGRTAGRRPLRRGRGRSRCRWPRRRRCTRWRRTRPRSRRWTRAGGRRRASSESPPRRATSSAGRCCRASWPASTRR